MYQSFPSPSLVYGQHALPYMRHSTQGFLGYAQPPDASIMDLVKQVQEAKAEASLANKRLAEVLLQLHKNKELSKQHKEQDDLEYSYTFEDEFSTSQVEPNGSANMPPPERQEPPHEKKDTQPPAMVSSLSSLAGLQVSIPFVCVLGVPLTLITSTRDPRT